MFSKTCQYGLRAALFIANQSIKGEKVGLAKVAKEIGSPRAFTAKILQTLTRKEIIEVVKGPYGGFLISKAKLKKTTLNTVVSALDNDKKYTACLLGLKKCTKKNPCPLHFDYLKIRENLKKILENTLYETLKAKKKIEKLILKP